MGCPPRGTGGQTSSGHASGRHQVAIMGEVRCTMARRDLPSRGSLSSKAGRAGLVSMFLEEPTGLASHV